MYRHQSSLVTVAPPFYPGDHSRNSPSHAALTRWLAPTATPDTLPVCPTHRSDAPDAASHNRTEPSVEPAASLSPAAASIVTAGEPTRPKSASGVWDMRESQRRTTPSSWPVRRRTSPRGAAGVARLPSAFRCGAPRPCPGAAVTAQIGEPDAKASTTLPLRRSQTRATPSAPADVTYTGRRETSAHAVTRGSVVAVVGSYACSPTRGAVGADERLPNKPRTLTPAGVAGAVIVHVCIRGGGGGVCVCVCVGGGGIRVALSSPPLYSKGGDGLIPLPPHNLRTLPEGTSTSPTRPSRPAETARRPSAERRSDSMFVPGVCSFEWEESARAEPFASPRLLTRQCADHVHTRPSAPPVTTT